MADKPTKINAYDQLDTWPEVFSNKHAIRLLDKTPHIVSVYLARWKAKGLIESTGPRTGVYFNLVANRHAAEERLVEALLFEFPTAVLIGESVLHSAGWTTQIPAKIQIACLEQRSFPIWDRFTFHPRPLAWYKAQHDNLIQPDQAVFSTYGLRSLSPAEALADMHANAADHWIPDADDLDIPPEEMETVRLAFDLNGLALPEYLEDRPSHRGQRY